MRYSEISANPWPFLALNFGWTWVFWLPAVLLAGQNDAPGGLVAVLVALGGIGPALAAIFLLYTRHTPAFQRDYWRRAIAVGAIRPGWYALILLLYPLFIALAALLDLLLGGSGGQLEATAQLLNPLRLIPYGLFILFFGPVPEELGWRGYALDGLQRRYTALGGSLLLGTAWAVWHLPLFFIEGSYQQGLGLGTLEFWLFMLNLLPGSIVITWIYNHTQRSTLSAILVHFMGNFSGELVALSSQAAVLQLGLWTVLAIALVIRYGARTLMGRADFSA
jgi:membrane protease YdiL (CAAX protease family)